MKKRGGFTLVELLVVIGIIAILAGVALGPITNGIKKAKESAGVQSAHAIGLAMYSLANDNQQLYADQNNPAGNTGGATAQAAVGPLLAGGYVTDPSIFYISSDSAAVKYTGTLGSAASQIASSNVSWDFVGVTGGTGLSSVNYPSTPIMWSTLGGGTMSNIATANNAVQTAAALPSTTPFGTAGLAVFYENNSAAFVTANTAGIVTLVTAANNSNPPGSYVALPGL